MERGLFTIHSWIFLVGFQSYHSWKCVFAYSRRRNVFGVSLFLLSTPPGRGVHVCIFGDPEKCVCVPSYSITACACSPRCGLFPLIRKKRRISTCICSGSKLNKHCLQHPSSHTWISSIRRSQLNRREGRPQV